MRFLLLLGIVHSASAYAFRHPLANFVNLQWIDQSYAQESENSTETDNERKKREIEGSGDAASVVATTTTTATEIPTTTPEFQEYEEIYKEMNEYDNDEYYYTPEDPNLDEISTTEKISTTLKVSTTKKIETSTQLFRLRLSLHLQLKLFSIVVKMTKNQIKFQFLTRILTSWVIISIKNCTSMMTLRSIYEKFIKIRPQFLAIKIGKWRKKFFGQDFRRSDKKSEKN